MQKVIKLLLHTVDLESSPWATYTSDPRCIGFFRKVYFGSSSDRPDFWLLVNAMCDPALQCPTSLNTLDFTGSWSGGGSTGFATALVDHPVLSDSRYDSAFAVSRDAKKATAPLHSLQSFLGLYCHHLNVAESLSGPDAFPDPVVLPDAVFRQDWDRLNGVFIRLDDGSRGWIQVRNDEFDATFPLALGKRTL